MTGSEAVIVLRCPECGEETAHPAGCEIGKAFCIGPIWAEGEDGHDPCAFEVIQR